MSGTLEQFLSGDRSRWSYLYSYPHKTAYRPFEAPLRLQDLWQGEDRSNLYLYAHIPFCASKCSFCNLFSLAHPQAAQVDRYLDQLDIQAGVVRDALGAANFSGYAIGGGTPSLLTVAQLERLFSLLEARFGISPARGGSFEASPDTLTEEHLRYLVSVGLERLSLGVQSFDAEEARLLGRPRPDAGLDRLLERIVRSGFPVFNLDLIYGTPGQTPATFRASLEKALRYHPAEIFLYPLYVRPLTPLHRRSGGWDPEGERMDALLETGVQILASHGYRQDSLRLFRRADLAPTAGGEYSCQEDGMVGLGVGARSYTRHVHYSSAWAVDRAAVGQILDGYLDRPASSFACADHGIVLSEDDRKRRFLIKSLLKVAGLDRGRYAAVFGTEVLVDFPDLSSLEALGLARIGTGVVELTSRGIALSDGIGAWLIGPEVAARMAEFHLR